MVATIKVAKFQGTVECILFNGTQFTIKWLDTGTFPKHWHGLTLCHKNHIHL